MVPNDRAFDGRSYFHHGGKTFFRWHYFSDGGEYKLVFKVVAVNSCNRQGIALFFDNFAGRITLDGQELPIPNEMFGHYLFKAEDISNDGLSIEVQNQSGSIYIGNASERSEVGLYTCGAFANAFWIEQLSSNQFRFHCNDHEYDDDFDDFIFDVEVFRQAAETEEWS